MAENVKIVIREINETTPTGAGVGSDVAYVPGITYSDAGKQYVNKPVLCSSISEFEEYFGATPYELTAADVSGTNPNKLTAGTPDLSYLYAKELILAGIPVYYEAIVNIAGADEAYYNKLKASRKTLLEAQIDAEADLKVKSLAITPEDASKGITYNNEAYKTKFATDYTTAAADKKAAYDTAKDAALTASTDVITFNTQYAVITAGGGYTNISVEVFSDNDDKKQTVSTPKCICDLSAETSRLTYFYNELGNHFGVLTDKDEYTVKYITSGGYPTFLIGEDGSAEIGLASQMLAVAAERGDAVAIIDHEMDNDAPLAPVSMPDSIYYKVNKTSWANGQYGAMFTPYGTYSLATYTDNTVVLPASFAYLRCLATAIKTSPNWLAMAGVTRGVVPGLQSINTRQILSNTIAEEYQPKFGSASNRVSINAITNIKPYGLTIWGNRTLQTVSETGTTALNFLNTRNMVSDIKKVVRNAAKTLMFEQDSEVLWNKFKSRIAPTLDKLKSGFGISDYKILRAEVKPHNGDSLTKGELGAIIRIYPLYAIEYFDISIILSDPDAQ